MSELAEARLGRWISRTLSIGMLLAVAIIGIGVVLGLVTGTGLEIGPVPGGLLAEIGAGKPGSIVLLGIVALALTPVAELAVAALAFGRAGERRYLMIALVVLGLLVGSIAIAAALNPAAGG